MSQCYTRMLRSCCILLVNALSFHGFFPSALRTESKGLCYSAYAPLNLWFVVLVGENGGENSALRVLLTHHVAPFYSRRQHQHTTRTFFFRKKTDGSTWRGGGRVGMPEEEIRRHLRNHPSDLKARAPGV